MTLKLGIIQLRLDRIDKKKIWVIRFFFKKCNIEKNDWKLESVMHNAFHKSYATICGFVVIERVSDFFMLFFLLDCMLIYAKKKKSFLPIVITIPFQHTFVLVQTQFPWLLLPSSLLSTVKLSLSSIMYRNFTFLFIV